MLLLRGSWCERWQVRRVASALDAGGEAAGGEAAGSEVVLVAGLTAADLDVGGGGGGVRVTASRRGFYGVLDLPPAHSPSWSKQRRTLTLTR